LIKLTLRAAEKFKADLRTESLPESTMLRIDRKCGRDERNVRLALFFDTDEPSRDNAVRVIEGVRLVITNSLAHALGNAQLEYRADEGGFVLERIWPPQ
jgi:Fe-S cluster assembly iron-binding protein IscA